MCLVSSFRTNSFTEYENDGQHQYQIQGNPANAVLETNFLRVSILSFLTSQNIAKLETVNKQFKASVHTPLLWKEKSREIGIQTSATLAEKIDLRRTCIQTIIMRKHFFNEARKAADWFLAAILVEESVAAVQGEAYSDIFKAQVQAGYLSEAFITAKREWNPFLKAQAQFLQLVKLQVQAGDMKGAKKTFKMIKMRENHGSASLELVKGQARDGDMNGAFTTTHQIKKNRFLKAKAYLEIAKVKAKTNKKEATATCGKALEKVHKIEEARAREEAYLEVAKVQAQIDKPKAADLVRGGHLTADQIISPLSSEGRKTLKIVIELVKAGNIPGALETADQIGNPFLKALSYIEIAKIQVQANTLEAACTLAKAFKTADQIDAPFEKAEIYAKIAKVQIQIDTQEAASTYKKMIQMSTEVLDADDRVKTNLVIARTYIQIEKYRNVRIS